MEQADKQRGEDGRTGGRELQEGLESAYLIRDAKTQAQVQCHRQHLHLCRRGEVLLINSSAAAI